MSRGTGGRASCASARLSRAEELVGDSVTASAARVLATSGRMHVIAGEMGDGRRVAEAALQIAEQLGLDELRAHALTTVGMAKRYMDDPSGIEDMERALALALEIDSPVATATMNNLGVQATIAGDLRRGEELHMESLRLATRFGDSANARFMRGNMIFVSFVRGRWESALEGAEAFIAECEAGSPHTLEQTARAARGMIRLARGDHDGALADHERMLALGRERQQAEGLVAGLAMLAVTQAELGMVEEARNLLGELVPLVRDHGVYARSAQAALFASPLDVPEDLRAAIAGSMGERTTLWRNVISSALDGDLRGAADQLAAMGSPTMEARFRFYAGARMLEAGRTGEGRSSSTKALAFYRSVDATFYVERARGCSPTLRALPLGRDASPLRGRRAHLSRLACVRMRVDRSLGLRRSQQLRHQRHRACGTALLRGSGRSDVSAGCSSSSSRGSWTRMTRYIATAFRIR